jgi:hypothetical protein
VDGGCPLDGGCPVDGFGFLAEPVLFFAFGFALACAIGFALLAVVFFPVAGFLEAGDFVAFDFLVVVFFAMIILLNVLCKSPYGGFLLLYCCAP